MTGSGGNSSMGDAVQNTIRGIFAQLEIVFGRVRAGDLQSLYTPEEWLNLAVTAAGFCARRGARRNGSRTPAPPGARAPATRNRKERRRRRRARWTGPRTAREKYRALLARKQLPAADIDVRVAEFQPAFDAAKDRLQALGIDETSAAILFAEARDALQDGEYRRVVNLVCLAADKCAEESRDRRTAAQKCARTAIVARALAGELELAQLEYAAAAELFGQAAAGAPEGDEDFLAAQLEKQESAAYLGGDHKTALAAFERALALLEGKLGPTMPTWRRR